jgi:phage-related protein
LNEELKIFIKAEIADLKKNLGEAQKEVKETAKEGESGFKKFGAAAKEAGKVVAAGLAAAGAAIVSAGAALLGLAEGTREFRTNMAKLETAFVSAGGSADLAGEAYTKLYGILGDEGKATETAAFIAKLSADQEQLSTWTGIAAGVYATFGDSLPIEALAEAANETAKTGQITGALADALNWAGISEEEFQASLDECADEAERNYLINEQLVDSYWDAGEAFQETNANIIAANEAQANFTATLAELGAIAEPIMTTLKNLASDLLTSITPFVSLIGEGLTGALNGADGAADTLAEGVGGLISTALDKVVEIAPFVIDTILSLFPVLLKEILGKLPDILQTILTIFTSVLRALGEMLPTLIPVIIDAVVMCAETLLDNVDMIVDAGIELIIGLADGLLIALPRLIDKIPVIIEKLMSAIANNSPKVYQTGIELIVKLAAGLVAAIPQLVEQIPQIISAVVDGLKSYAVNMASVFSPVATWIYDNVIEPVADFFTGLWESIKGGATAMWDAICGVFSTIATWIYDNVIEPVADFFAGLWDGIVKTFHTVIDPWIEIIKRAAKLVYDNVIKPVADFFKELWDGIVNGLRAAWDAIKGVFSAVGSWINTHVIQPVAKFFSSLWDGFKNGASKAWEGVKAVFSKVADFFGNIFTKAWEKVKAVFSVGGKIFDGIKDGIVTAFKTIVNAIITGINKVITVPFNALNAILAKLHDIEILEVKPFSWVHTFEVPQIPKLARGGVVDSATIAMIGERGKEAVVPLENNLEWLDKLAAKLADKMGGGRPVVLKVGEKVFAETTFSAWNNYVEQTGNCPVKVW